MSHQQIAHKKNYLTEKPSTLWEGPSVTCGGYQVNTKSYGYQVSHCEKIIKGGDTVYFRRDCECKVNIGPFCSMACGWHSCCKCDRKICNNCYRYGRGNCIYCKHKGDQCQCDNDEYCAFTEDEYSSSLSSDEEDSLTEEIAIRDELIATNKRLIEVHTNIVYLQTVKKRFEKQLKTLKRKRVQKEMIAAKKPRSSTL